MMSGCKSSCVCACDPVLGRVRAKATPKRSGSQGMGGPSEGGLSARPRVLEVGYYYSVLNVRRAPTRRKVLRHVQAVCAGQGMRWVGSLLLAEMQRLRRGGTHFTVQEGARAVWGSVSRLGHVGAGSGEMMYLLE